MEDPVTLPTSKQVLDRSTIRSHLLSDPNDPFNRQPLTIEQVIPNTELKNKIQEWKSARLAEKMRERATAAETGGEPMDIS
jgi:ubiquitin conjugation factor E4 B